MTQPETIDVEDEPEITKEIINLRTPEASPQARKQPAAKETEQDPEYLKLLEEVEAEAERERIRMRLWKGAKARSKATAASSSSRVVEREPRYEYEFEFA